MPLFNAPNISAGIDDALITTAQEVYAFPIMVLVFIFSVVLLGGTANQKRRTGWADYPFWSVLAGISTTFMALIFSIGGGIINVVTLGIVVSITVLCAIWFFLSKNRGEL